MKGYQCRYYVRMREIEYTAYLINSVTLDGKYGDRQISAPRIDMTWGFKGYPEKPMPDNGDHAQNSKTDPGDWRADEPWRRSPQEIYSDLRRRWHWSNVMLPHVLAVVLGAVLFIVAAFRAPGFQQFHL